MAARKKNSLMADAPAAPTAAAAAAPAPASASPEAPASASAAPPDVPSPPASPAADEPEPASLADLSPSPAPASAPASGAPAPPAPALSSPDRQLSLDPFTQARKLDEMRLIEAALFMSGRPLQAVELAKLVGIAAVGHVTELLKRLSAHYEQSGSAMEVVEDSPGRWAMRLRAAYSPAVRSFASEAEIGRHALRTLAYVSRHPGITKRDLFNRLGSTIYEDVQELVEKGFLSATPSGRTVALTPTAKFKQYFEG